MDQKDGLSTAAAAERRQTSGYNEIPPQRVTLWSKILHWLISPITLMLLLAAGLSFYSQRQADGDFILVLVVLNFVIGYLQERKADTAIAQLQKKLVVTVKVRRDGSWQSLPARLLVPDDLVQLNVGDLVAADLELINGDNFSVNESSITGESLPQEKALGATVYSGSSVATGNALGIVRAIGGATVYGKTLLTVEKATKRSLLQTDISSIALFLSVASLVGVLILSVVLLAAHGRGNDILRLDLSLVIAGIPVSMPTVMSIIVSLGILGLSQREVIVRQMSALENLSNVTLLLTDKTGTLTENTITVEQIIPLDGFTEEEMVQYAAFTAHNPEKNPIERALVLKAQQFGHRPGSVTSFVPADSIRKRATAHLQLGRRKLIISLGAPQVIAGLCRRNSQQQKNLAGLLNDAANHGYRALALALKEPDDGQEKNLRLTGLLLLSDTIRPGAKEILDYLAMQGIDTKIVTGDSRQITNRVAHDLGLSGSVVTRSALRSRVDNLAHWWRSKAGFAEVLPEDKYHLVERAKKDSVVAVTGDGVNDLPAIAAADVGIAVSNAVDALKSSADIVMLASGISYIRDALLEARKIFERLYSYTVYRISESFRVIVTITILGIAIHSYPITPIQLLLLVFLNDLPIITLAYNHVRLTNHPAQSRSRDRFKRGLLLGTMGIGSSLGMYYLLAGVLKLPMSIVQTAFFLKLAVSGHMLIYVAHTNERWFRFLPSPAVIWATTVTQLLASLVAGIGLLMSPISLSLILFVWGWSFIWMQLTDLVKGIVPQE